jgi:hypothetical protein
MPALGHKRANHPEPKLGFVRYQRQEINAHSRRIRTNQSTLRGVRISAGRFERRAPA